MATRKAAAKKAAEPDCTTCAVKVRLDRSGVTACGEYRHGVVYTITDPKLATHLLEAKGFTRIANSED